MPGRFNNRGRGGRQKPPRYSNTQVQQPLSQNMSQSQASQVCQIIQFLKPYLLVSFCLDCDRLASCKINSKQPATKIDSYAMKIN